MNYGDPFGRRQAQREQMYADVDAHVAAEQERKRRLQDRTRAMLAWAAPRRAAAADRKRREETATIREAGKEERGRPRSNSAYGGSGRKTLRRNRGKKSLKRTRRSRR